MELVTKTYKGDDVRLYVEESTIEDAIEAKKKRFKITDTLEL